MQPAGIGAMGLMFLAPFVAGGAPAAARDGSQAAAPAARLRVEPAVLFSPDLLGEVDWSPVQMRLAPQLASLAGGGEGLAPVERLAKLLAEAGARTPVVLAARGAAVPTVEAYAALYPDQVAGLVLVDPAPAAAATGGAPGGVSRAELAPWRAAAQQALAAGPLDRELPVAVVLSKGTADAWRQLQAGPARRSRAGYLATVETRAGRSISAPLAEAVARAVRHVRRLSVEPPMARAYA